MTQAGQRRAQSGTGIDAINAAEAAIHESRGSNIVITECVDRARELVRPGLSSGRLEGWTLAVKDMIDVAGLPTTRGSAIYGHLDALETATCVERLESEGASLVAKVNLHEFAYGVTSENPHWGDVRNPRHPRLIPGGSSGGTAAAIAAGIARIGLGTDTAGSIRMPAACCGVVGLRPRTGVVPGKGVAALAPSFDVVGPMAATVADTAQAWAALSLGKLATPRPFQGLVIGVIGDTPVAEPLREFGAELRPFRLPDGILEPFWIAFRAEATRTHEGTFPRFAESYSLNVRAKLQNASGVSAADYASAVRELARLREEFARSMAGIDLVISSTLGCPAPEAGCDEVDIRDDLGRLAAPFSALNLPALAIGNLQIIGRTETDVVAAGLEWESTVGDVPLPF